MRLIAVLFDGITLAWLADPDDTKPDELFVLIDTLVEAAVGRSPALGGDRLHSGDEQVDP
jgi:hypothetical protein